MSTLQELMNIQEQEQLMDSLFARAIQDQDLTEQGILLQIKEEFDQLRADLIMCLEYGYE